MPTNPSYDGNGLVVLSTAEVRENIEEAIRGSSEFGEEAQLAADKVLGQLVDPFSEQLGLAYELLPAIVDARDPERAENVQLDSVAEISGIRRNAATPSTVTLTMDVDVGTTVIAGKRARVPNGPIFASDADVEGDGTGTQLVGATCTETGPNEAASGTIDQIVDAVSGWNSVTNASDATPGTSVQTDVQLRLDRDRLFDHGGTARPQAIRINVETLSFVEAAAVLENVTAVTDGDGLPPHSYRTYVYPGGLAVDQEKQICRKIWEVTPAGIYIGGSEAYDVTDAAGQLQTVRFSFGTASEIYGDLDIQKNDEYPATGDTLVKQAMVDFGTDNYTMGSIVYPDQIRRYLYAVVPGLEHVEIRIKEGGAPGASDTDPIDPGRTVKPYHTTGNITVTSV
jgi:hypothetical protein